jgi:hypothetical protein
MSELASLLESAQAAAPDHRIEWRDRIAAHGADAIEGIRPWLVDEGLAAFAVRVIELAGSNGEAALATKVLRAARPRVPAVVVGDIDWALVRVKASQRPAATTPVTPKAAAPARPVRREPLRAGVAPRRPSR